HLAVIEIGVARLQQPAPAGLDGDADVAECVARQGHHEHFRRHAVEAAHAVEAEPALAAAGPVDPPTLLVRPLLRPVALAIEPARLSKRPVALDAEQV